jgi:hypothetical protein
MVLKWPKEGPKKEQEGGMSGQNSQKEANKWSTDGLIIS